MPRAFSDEAVSASSENAVKSKTWSGAHSRKRIAPLMRVAGHVAAANPVCSPRWNRPVTLTTTPWPRASSRAWNACPPAASTPGQRRAWPSIAVLQPGAVTLRPGLLLNPGLRTGVLAKAPNRGPAYPSPIAVHRNGSCSPCVEQAARTIRRFKGLRPARP